MFYCAPDSKFFGRRQSPACLTMMLDLRVACGCIHHFTFLVEFTGISLVQSKKLQGVATRTRSVLLLCSTKYSRQRSWGGLDLQTSASEYDDFYERCNQGDDNLWPQERSEWVLGLSHTILLIIDSLLPMAEMSCDPVPGVPKTFRRLLAGYLIHRHTPRVWDAACHELLIAQEHPQTE